MCERIHPWIEHGRLLESADSMLLRVPIAVHDEFSGECAHAVSGSSRPPPPPLWPLIRSARLTHTIARSSEFYETLCPRRTVHTFWWRQRIIPVIDPAAGPRDPCVQLAGTTDTFHVRFLDLECSECWLIYLRGMTMNGKLLSTQI